MGSNDIDFSGLKIAFRSYHGTYLCALEGKGTLVITKPHRQSYEQWTVVDKGNSTVCLRSHHGTFLRAWPGQRAKVDLHDSDSHWETFSILALERNLYAIKSVFHGGYVTSHRGIDAKVDIAPSIASWEQYSIEVISQLDSIKDVIFNLDKAILQTTPVVLSAISLQNQKALPVKLSHTFNVEISSTSFFTQKHGVKNASKTLIVAKIPFLNTEGEIDLSDEMNIDWTPGRVITNTRTISSTVSIEAWPQLSSKISLSALKSAIEIPWSATAVYLEGGKEIYKAIDGIWNGTMVYNVNYTVE